MPEMTEHQKFIAQLAAVLIAPRPNPHPSVVSDAIDIAVRICEETKQKVRQ